MKHVKVTNYILAFDILGTWTLRHLQMATFESSLAHLLITTFGISVILIFTLSLSL